MIKFPPKTFCCLGLAENIIRFIRAEGASLPRAAPPEFDRENNLAQVKGEIFKIIQGERQHIDRHIGLCRRSPYFSVAVPVKHIVEISVAIFQVLKEPFNGILTFAGPDKINAFHILHYLGAK